MDVFRITILSLLLWMTYVPCSVTGLDLPPKHAMVGEMITLRCPSGENFKDDFHAWYRGQFSEEEPPPTEAEIFRGKGENVGEGKKKRADMTIDKGTFMMTLEVQNGLTDNDFFTCVTEGFKKKYDVTQLLIFSQPVVTISADPQPDEGVNVTVTCSVDNLYPNITSSQFTMEWGKFTAGGTKFSGVQNANGFMQYTLEKTKNLTQEDRGLDITCTVTPKRDLGDPGVASMTLNFTTGPEEPTDPGASTDGGSDVGAIVGGVIGGLAAVVVIGVIVVIILKKKKPKKDKATKQPAAGSTRTKTNKPVTEDLMYANLDLVNESTRLRVEEEGSVPPVTPRPVQEPTEYAQIDFDKLKVKKERDEEDLCLSDKEQL